MTGILTPATAVFPAVDWGGVPRNLKYNYEGRVAAVCRSHEECAGLCHFFRGIDWSPAYGPFQPVFIYIPGAPQLIDGQGLSPVEELRDMAVAIWEIISGRLQKTGTTVDFDSLRERHGLMRKEDVDAATREAFWERAQKHKANPISDPARQPKYPRVRGKTVFSQPQSTDWKEAH